MVSMHTNLYNHDITTFNEKNTTKWAHWQATAKKGPLLFGEARAKGLYGYSIHPRQFPLETTGRQFADDLYRIVIIMLVWCGAH
jgi:hypothetical protein